MIILTAGKNFIRFLVFLTIVTFHSYSYALDWKKLDWKEIDWKNSYTSLWKITPSFTHAGTFSDNVNLGRKRSAFVRELSPGISIRREGVRNNLNLDYRMQNLLNAGGEGTFQLSTFHQLQTDSYLELVRNSFYLDINGSISQQNTTNLNRAIDNLSGAENRTTVSHYSLSPYWTPHLNGYADGKVKFSYKNLNLNNSMASDTENFDYSVKFKSGKRFSRLSWFVDYNKRDQFRENGEDVRFRDSLVELRGHISRHYSLFARAGHSKNIFKQTTDNHKNGFFYMAGAKWKPSKRFSLEGAYGNNYFVTLDIAPLKLMHWVTTYRNNDIGTNTGGVWESTFNYKTRNSIWKASYEEKTGTVQDELFDIQTFTVTDDFGNPIIDPVTQQPFQSDISLPAFKDEVAIIKKAEASASYKTGKTSLFIRFFDKKVTFQETQTINDVIGINASWNWYFTRRTSFFLRPAWQHKTEELPNNINRYGDSHRYDISLGLSRRIPLPIGRRSTLNVKLEYQYAKQTSDIENIEFTENRISANLFLSF